jgi:hypothetical protein
MNYLLFFIILFTTACGVESDAKKSSPVLESQTEFVPVSYFHYRIEKTEVCKVGDFRIMRMDVSPSVITGCLDALKISSGGEYMMVQESVSEGVSAYHVRLPLCSMFLDEKFEVSSQSSRMGGDVSFSHVYSKHVGSQRRYFTTCVNR